MRTTRTPVGRYDMPALHARHLVRRLAGIRADAQLTQREFARRIQVARNTLVRWESGTLTPTTLNLLVWLIGLEASVTIVDQDGRIRHVRMAGTGDLEADARDVYRRIAAILAAERRRLGITQAQIAENPGLGKVRHWEHARQPPTLEHLLAWCREIGCKLLIGLPAHHPAVLRRRSAPARPSGPISLVA